MGEEFKTARDLSKAIKSKKISVREAVENYVNLAKLNKHNAFLKVLEISELEERISEVQKKIDAGELTSPLAGVPIAIKDNISTLNVATTCASKTLDNYVPVYNAAVIERLEEAGLIVIGKTNMDEFAMGGSSETGYKGAVLNPINSECVSGGSSGGSAAAVAGGEALISLGSDTGGSIRQPCAFCGTAGIKPTYGSVSRYGLIAYASSLDQIGPIGKDIEDCARLLEIISGKDERDSTCIIDKSFDFNEALKQENANLKGMKIGLPRNYFTSGIDDDVKEAVLKAAKVLEKAGAVLEEFDMPLMDYIIHAYYIIACAEASSNLSRYDGLKYGHRSPDAKTLPDVYRKSRSEGFGLEVKRRIMLGSFVLSSGYYDAYYKKALQTRALLKNAYNDLFKKYDIIISPVAPTPAYKIGDNVGDPIKMYMGDIYTVSINLAGLPSVALPCGVNEAGLPLGFQLIGDSFTEEKLVRAGKGYELAGGS